MSLAIQVATGTGQGSTTLAAFDAALRATGAANYNLIRLSSIIPTDSTISIAPPDRPLKPGGEWGDRLYAVWADQRAHEPNEEAWAGLGWARETDTGRGLFVEHWGTTERQVRRDIEDTLSALAVARGIVIGDYESAVVGIVCDSAPVCALAIAVFAVTPWSPRHEISTGSSAEFPTPAVATLES
jgi:arginine decarboxylase